MSKVKRIYQLFLSFFKIGLFTFGGGYAMISLLQREFVSRRKWLRSSEFFDIVAIAESTPGPIAVNMATYIGYKMGKAWGAIVATLSVCLPSFIIIYIISLFFDQFIKLKYVYYAFKGIQVCVIYLILSIGVKLLMKLHRSTLNLILLIGTMICMLVCSLLSINFSSIFYILIGGFVGYILYLIRHYQHKKYHQEEIAEDEKIDIVQDSTTNDKEEDHQ